MELQFNRSLTGGPFLSGFSLRILYTDGTVRFQRKTTRHVISTQNMGVMRMKHHRRERKTRNDLKKSNVGLRHELYGAGRGRRSRAKRIHGAVSGNLADLCFCLWGSVFQSQVPLCSFFLPGQFTHTAYLNHNTFFAQTDQIAP